MNKSIRLLLPAFVVITTLLSGCSSGSTSISLTPSPARILPTETPNPTATLPPPTSTIIPVTPTQEIDVYTSGSLDIPQTWVADLDKGTLVDFAHNSEGDIWFEAVTDTERYITVKGFNSYIALVGHQAPNYLDCQSADFSEKIIAISDLSVGTYACVKTSEGHYSRVRIDAPVGPSPGTLSISFTTW